MMSQLPRKRTIPYSNTEVKRVVSYILPPVDSSLLQPNKFSMYRLLLLFLGWAVSSTPNNPQRNSPIPAITISVL